MNVEQSIYILGLLIVGGMRSVRGAFLGVALLATLPQYLELDPVIRPVIVGVAMAAVVLLAPDHGLIGLPGRLRERFRRPDRPKGGGRAAPPAAGGGNGPVAAGSAPGPMPEGARHERSAARTRRGDLHDRRRPGRRRRGPGGGRGTDRRDRGPERRGQDLLFNAITGFIPYQVGDALGGTVGCAAGNRTGSPNSGLMRTFQKRGRLRGEDRPAEPRGVGP